MHKIAKIFFGLFLTNLFILNILYSFSENDGLHNLKSFQELFTKDNRELQVNQTSLFGNRPLKSFQKSNPLYLLGAYPEIGLTYFNNKTPQYDWPNYELIHEDDYCFRVDSYNLANPENMFHQMNFFTDLSPSVAPRKSVMDKIGNVTMKGFSVASKQRDSIERKYHLDHTITSFFVNYASFHLRHEIGKHFLCATQMYNRIPGYEPMVRKDQSLAGLKRYADKFNDRSECLNKGLFPKSYRLYIEEECSEFFQIITSVNYRLSTVKEPIQYLIKVGHDSHRSDGVFLLDQNQWETLNEEYDFGKQCGNKNSSLIAQAYVSNPLLLDMDNKFDFRVYMLIASTNPLIVYYHDGFLRVALSPYDKHSKERGTHLTNTHLAQKKFDEAKHNTVNGMNEAQLKEYHLWSFDKLQAFLLESGKITDSNWLDNYLRPAFQKAFIHLVRMGKDDFWKQSNVYQLFGLDFMLDDNLNLWYIEGNPNPQLHQNTPKMSQMMNTMLKDMFEIQYSYYRSRMSRLMEVIARMQMEAAKKKYTDYEKWQAEYQEAAKNTLEPEYQISKDNTFKLIMDENLSGSKAYFGHISSKCV
jgi:hypothetical protein